jgi:GntR family transcriptional repressor for pyruvate dehydrogenase complex
MAANSELTSVGQANGRSGDRGRRLVKTSETVALSIVHDIVARGLTTGDRLPLEAAMLQQYRVSRASLREALRLLEVQGLIHIRAGPKGGPVVGAATAENLARMLTLYFGLAGSTYEDLAQVMLILNPIVAEVAASTRLDPSEVAALNASLDQACGAPNPKLIRDETLLDFHRIIVTFGQNSVWSLLADAVSLIFSDHVIAAADSRGFHATAVNDHNKIAAAILAGNPRLASRHMLKHTERMIEFYRGQTPSLFAQLIEWR